MRLDRFLSKISSKDGCWIWGAAISTGGYGAFYLEGKTMHAHRAAYKLLVGNVPDDMDVCHTCDNRKCVNPKHLFVGTRMDNMQDAVVKGRLVGKNHVCGGDHPSSKLDEVMVASMRIMAKDGVSAYSLAKRYGVSHNAAWQAIKGSTWKSVKEEPVEISPLRRYGHGKETR